VNMHKTSALLIFLALISVFAGCRGPTSPEQNDGILTIDGYGAMYIGSGVTGEIDGHDYLFVNLNTEGSEPHVIPGILVLDIENPANPKELSHLQAPEETLFIASLAISGTTLYVCASDFLWTVDVSRPAQPETIGTFTGVKALRMAISGNYAYVNDGNRQITVVDITEPAELRIVGGLELASRSGIILGTYGSVLYVKTSQKLHIIDITSPDTPREINTFTATIKDKSGGEATCYLMQFSISDHYAYTILRSEEGEAIAVLDLSDPFTPREITRFELKSRLLGGSLFVSGDRGYIVSMVFSPGKRTNQDMLQALDLSEPDNPKLLDSYYLPGIEEYFSTVYGGYISGYGLVNGFLYRFIGNAPNDPVIVAIDLPNM
jgi:hypothetical protein